jgi:serine protease inhibitor
MNTRKILKTILRGGLTAALLGRLCLDSYAAPRSSASARSVIKSSPGNLRSANTGFAFNLLDQLAEEEPGSNIFISPYSASTVLQMVATGAAGTTSTEMQEALGTLGIAPVALDEANRELGHTINNGDTNVVLNTANSVWYLNQFPIEWGFLKGNQDYFGAKVAGLDFTQPASADVINAWASDETHGKIDQIVTWPMDPSLKLLLANAVYFHGNWQNAFDSDYTAPGPFYLSGGGQESIPMMEQTTNFDYYATDSFQAVRLPYQGSNIAMYVFLPNPIVSLEDLLRTMSGQEWQQTVNTYFAEHPGTVVLPRFSVNYSVHLNDALQSLGMKTAFTDEADFSKISSVPLRISDVKQQAVIEVNEVGTVATAVTPVTITAKAVPPDPPFMMNVNRPFLYVIEDRQAATILFMGVMFAP